MNKNYIKMKNILAFAGSNSKNSINKQLVTYAASFATQEKVTILDLNDFNLPIYSVDLEETQGIPENAHKFLEYIKNADGLIVSLAEHNGAYSAVFKNLFDWMSRIEGKTFFGKPMLLMATSPGGRGGLSVLEIAKDRFPRHEANIVETFSLPFFNQNFNEGSIIDHNLNDQLKSYVELFLKAL